MNNINSNFLALHCERLKQSPVRTANIKLKAITAIDSLTSAISDSLFSHSEVLLNSYNLSELLSLEKKLTDKGYGNPDDIGAAVEIFQDRLNKIQDSLSMDIAAAMSIDPVRPTREEVILAYPGFYATVIYRLATLLRKLGFSLIARMWSTYAKSQTGIDIHPGAKIGPGFFIDHGEGVVIGETSRVGSNVTIYQGVTLGAILNSSSFQHPSDSQRHPTVEDHVTIFANATILGGNTIVSEGSIIACNTLILPPRKERKSNEL